MTHSRRVRLAGAVALVLTFLLVGSFARRAPAGDGPSTATPAPIDVFARAEEGDWSAFRLEVTSASASRGGAPTVVSRSTVVWRVRSVRADAVVLGVAGRSDEGEQRGAPDREVPRRKLTIERLIGTTWPLSNARVADDERTAFGGRYACKRVTFDAEDPLAGKKKTTTETVWLSAEVPGSGILAREQVQVLGDLRMTMRFELVGYGSGARTSAGVRPEWLDRIDEDARAADLRFEEERRIQEVFPLYKGFAARYRLTEGKGGGPAREVAFRANVALKREGREVIGCYYYEVEGGKLVAKGESRGYTIVDGAACIEYRLIRPAPSIRSERSLHHDPPLPILRAKGGIRAGATWEWSGRVTEKTGGPEGSESARDAKATFKVEALETVTVPAGRFEAYRVRETWSKDAEILRWFAKEMGIVKEQGRETLGGAPREWTLELVGLEGD
jgi:hypothetical protein